MPNAMSDAVIDVLRVCPHGIRFNLGAGWKSFKPGVGWRDVEGSGGQNLATQEDSGSRMRLQVASPPPSRVDGSHWEEGIRLSDGSENGLPLSLDDDAWKRNPVFHLEEIPALDQPAPSTVVYDGLIQLPLLETGVESSFIPDSTGFLFRAGGVDQYGFLSIFYPQPAGEVPVRYFGKYSLAWPEQLTPGGWLALSLDGFSPPERESADYIAHVEECGLPARHVHDGESDPFHDANVVNLGAAGA